MISKIEQEFYKVFEIPPATIQEYGSTYFWDTIEIDGKRYTPIDDRKLLEMICICSSYVRELNYDYEINAKNIDDLKEEILGDCIEYAKESQKFKYQIQQLFKY